MRKSTQIRKTPAQSYLKTAKSTIKRWWDRNWWNKFVAILLAVLIFCVGSMYGLAQWYMFQHRNEPITVGATFIPYYAEYFELDPKETMAAMIDELGFERLRLVTYWNVGEATQGTYDFSDFDWQMKMAEEKGVKVSLAIGLRQPRWPECHMPKWAMGMERAQWEPKLKKYIQAVVERYKDSPALHSYQLENEYFLKVFGECPDFTRQRLVDEYNLVKAVDPHHPVVVSMSNNAIGTPIYEPTPDMWAISIYKRVWDKTLTKRYVEYPFPAWYYAFRAGWVEIFRRRPSFVHELQAEAWVPGSFGTIKDAPLEEQNKSMNAERLHHRFEYGRATGMKTLDLWGAEWWYWRKVKMNDPSLWEAAKIEVAKTKAHNARLPK